MKRLPVEFYLRSDVLQVAGELLGKLLVTNRNGKITTGRIVECEAYAGVSDKASHAYGGRRTARNEAMYSKGGIAYIYICYGLHHLFNIVTNQADIPHAILIRALEPVSGLGEMLKRTQKEKGDYSVTRGPGNLSIALGISTRLNGISLLGDELFLADDGGAVKKKEMAVSPRIGVESAGKDALLPYRYYVKGNPFVSGRLR